VYCLLSRPASSFRMSKCVLTHMCVLSLNEEAGRALRSTSNQSSKPCEVSQCRVAKTYRMPHLVDHFPQISHYLQGSFAEKDQFHSAGWRRPIGCLISGITFSN